jgi:hypothetical protein
MAKVIRSLKQQVGRVGDWGHVVSEPVLERTALVIYVPWDGAVVWLSFVNTGPSPQVLFALVLPPAIWYAIRWVVHGRLR